MIQSYKDMKIELLEGTSYPAEKIALAISLTMSSDPEKTIPILTQKKCKFLLNAEHTSLFEHVNFTFLIQGISRSLAAQITRQRMSSFTSGSQHYQVYSDYPASIDKAHEPWLINGLIVSKKVYQDAIDAKVPREEARQVLPMAMTCNLLWTINARSLALFLRHRLCNRNVREMQIFATKVWALAADHFPELFRNVAKMCLMDGKCKQGKFSCGEFNSFFDK